MKTLLKPTVWKVLLTLILFILASLLWRFFATFIISDTFPYGFPLQFLIAWGPCPPGKNCSEFNLLFLVLDLAIWYLVSAFLVTRRKPR